MSVVIQDTEVNLGTADFVPATPLSHRNMIINGAMNVAQRGTSFTGVGDTTKTYSVDRFCYMFGYGTPAQRMTLTQTATGSSTIGFENSLKVDCTTVESNLGSNTSRYSGIFQLIEEQNLRHLLYGSSSAKTMTLSFYVKSSLTGTHGISVYINNGGAVLPQTYTVNTADTWERKTVSIAGNTSTAISSDYGMAIGFLLNTGTAQTSGTQNTWGSAVAYTAVANLMANTSYELSITGVQLELGSVATPFEHRSFGDELARCQRYYYAHTDGGTDKLIGKGGFNAASQFEASVHFKQTMRSTPTLKQVIGGGYYRIHAGGTTHDFEDLTIHAANNVDFGGCNALSLYKSSLSGTVGYAGNLVTNNALTYVHFDAEL